jgi:hypothetical protein
MSSTTEVKALRGTNIRFMDKVDNHKHGRVNSNAVGKELSHSIRCASYNPYKQVPCHRRIETEKTETPLPHLHFRADIRGKISEIVVRRGMKCLRLAPPQQLDFVAVERVIG